MSHHTGGRVSPRRPAFCTSRIAAYRIGFGVFTLSVSLTLLQAPASAQQMTAKTYAVARGKFDITEKHDDKVLYNLVPELKTEVALQPPGAVGQSAMNLFLTSMGANAHGCAGVGGDPFIVSGQGGSDGQVQEILHLTSSTLPMGTPVDVTFQYFATITPERKEGIVYGLDGVVISGDASVNVRGVITEGHYYYDSPRPGEQAHTPRTSGLFGDKRDATVVIKNVLVGEYFLLSANLSVYAFGGAALESYNAADVKAGIQWSGSAANCDIFIDATGAPFPTIPDAPPSNWGDVIPPFQLPTGIGGGAAPEPGTLALLGMGCSVWGLGIIRRKRR